MKSIMVRSRCEVVSRFPSLYVARKEWMDRESFPTRLTNFHWMRRRQQRARCATHETLLSPRTEHPPSKTAQQHSDEKIQLTLTHHTTLFDLLLLYCSTHIISTITSRYYLHTMAKKKKVVVSKSKRDDDEVVFDPYPVPVPHDHVSTVVYCSRRSTIYSDTPLLLLVCVIIFLTYNLIPTVTMNT
jgi:hypothetical protein